MPSRRTARFPACRSGFFEHPGVAPSTVVAHGKPLACNVAASANDAATSQCSRRHELERLEPGESVRGERANFTRLENNIAMEKGHEQKVGIADLNKRVS